MALALRLEEVKSMCKGSWDCSFDILSDCFLMISDVVPVDIFCLALMVGSIMDTIMEVIYIFGEMQQFQ
jgi:hypothetical protein